MVRMWAGRTRSQGTQQLRQEAPHPDASGELCRAGLRLFPTESAKGTCRMRALCLLLLSALGLLVSSKSLCLVDEAINEKIQEGTSSQMFAAIKNIHLDCRTVTSRGDLATCPADFTVTACTCGSACGSWDVRAETTCHCQCASMNWTGARCCRLQAAT